jgi:hypothetical protein
MENESNTNVNIVAQSSVSNDETKQNPTNNDGKQESVECKEKNKLSSNYTIRSVLLSRSVEYKDGKIVETRKGVKRKNNDWYCLNNEGKWEPTTKDKALDNSVISTKLIESPDSNNNKIEEGSTKCNDVVKSNGVCKRCLYHDITPLIMNPWSSWSSWGSWGLHPMWNILM